MKFLVPAVAAVLLTGPALADDKKAETPLPSAQGHLIGHDGGKWVVEGCAAYPVTAEAKNPSISKMAAKLRPASKPAASKPAATTLAQSKPVVSK